MCATFYIVDFLEELVLGLPFGTVVSKTELPLLHLHPVGRRWGVNRVKHGQSSEDGKLSLVAV